MTLGDILTKLVKGRLSFNAPTLQTNATILFEPSEGLEDDEIALYDANLAKVLSDLPGGGIQGGTVLYISDDTQGDLRVEVMLEHRAELDEEEFPEGFNMVGETPSTNQNNEGTKEAGASDPERKRERDDENKSPDGVTAKKQRTEGIDECEIIEL